MKFNDVHISFFLFLMIAKISHCQEGIPMIRSKDCPEFLMKNWQSRETVQDMDSLENFLYELGFPFAVVEETEHEPGRKEFQVNCGPEIKYVQVTWRQDSGWYLLSEEERTSIFSWEEMEHHRAAALHEMARSGY